MERGEQAGLWSGRDFGERRDLDEVVIPRITFVAGVTEHGYGRVLE